MFRLNENYRYKIQDEAAIEDFEDGSLLFLCRQRKMIEINPTARRVLDLMNGKRNLKQIIKIMSHDYKLNEKNIREDVHKLVNDLGTQGAIKPLVRVAIKRRQKMDKSASIMSNPDVSLREETDDGAILFNADTDSLLIINPVGLAMWRFIRAHPRTKPNIVAHLKEVCEDVPLDQVETDVDKFVAALQGKGFIGEVLDEKRSYRGDSDFHEKKAAG